MKESLPTDQSQPPDSQLDPIFVSSLREAKWIVAAWVVNFCWVIGYSLTFGYHAGEESGELATRWGMPAWVFWGVFVPWIVTTLFIAWFALTKMTDHPLDDELPSEAVDD